MEEDRNRRLEKMTFAITTKSGRSVNIKAANYKEAQKYADRHFGKGCIVQLVANSIVANALAAYRGR
jgi:hypothetical protein